ncbi:hypothetical protein WN943_007854 [Citrus x changshan-huyou]
MNNKTGPQNCRMTARLKKPFSPERWQQRRSTRRWNMRLAQMEELQQRRTINKRAFLSDGYFGIYKHNCNPLHKAMEYETCQDGGAPFKEDHQHQSINL